MCAVVGSDAHIALVRLFTDIVFLDVFICLLVIHKGEVIYGQSPNLPQVFFRALREKRRLVP